MVPNCYPTGTTDTPPEPTMPLTPADITLLLEALNSHEGVIAGDYQRARGLESHALADMLRRDLADIRALATRLAAQL